MKLNIIRQTFQHLYQLIRRITRVMEGPVVGNKMVLNHQWNFTPNELYSCHAKKKITLESRCVSVNLLDHGPSDILKTTSFGHLNIINSAILPTFIIWIAFKWLSWKAPQRPLQRDSENHFELSLSLTVFCFLKLLLNSVQCWCGTRVRKHQQMEKRQLIELWLDRVIMG